MMMMISLLVDLQQKEEEEEEEHDGACERNEVRRIEGETRKKKIINKVSYIFALA